VLYKCELLGWTYSVQVVVVEVRLECWEYLYYVFLYLELVVYLLSTVLFGTRSLASTLV